MPLDQSTYIPAEVEARSAMPEGHRRLLVLADFLEAHVPEREFNIKYYSNKAPKDFGCGTVGCALGWATAIPEFQALGFRADPRFKTFCMPIYRAHTDTAFSAGMAFFDIDYPTAHRFFSAHAYAFEPSRMEVVSRIRAFVAERRRKEIV